jgi:hypothetical protein
VYWPFAVADGVPEIVPVVGEMLRPGGSDTALHKKRVQGIMQRGAAQCSREREGTGSLHSDGVGWDRRASNVRARVCNVVRIARRGVDNLHSEQIEFTTDAEVSMPRTARVSVAVVVCELVFVAVTV